MAIWCLCQIYYLLVFMFSCLCEYVPPNDGLHIPYTMYMYINDYQWNLWESNHSD